jgi:tetratricopeptide (TPR) repeat protein
VYDHYPEDPGIISQLGHCYQLLGQTKKALECFEKLCELKPKDPVAAKALKDATALDSMQKDGWSKTAEEGGTFRDVLKDTEEATVLEQESKAVKSEKDVDSLIQDNLSKIEAEPENVNYYRALARLYSQKKMFDEASATLSKALEYHPGDPEVESAISGIRAQQLESEIQELEKSGDSEALEQKRLEKEQFVFDDLQARVERYPNDLRLRYELGVMLFNNDYLSEAVEQFQLAQKNPQHRAKSLYYLGLCFKAKGQNDLAIEQLEAAAGELTRMDETKKDILYAIGETYEAMDNADKARDCYKQIYQVDIRFKDVAAKVEQGYSGS